MTSNHKKPLTTLLAIASMVAASLIAPAIQAAGSHPPIKLGAERGLTTDYITSIAQDNRGVMWFGTHAGLFRFDGYGFRQFSVPAGLNPGNTVETLCMDPTGEKLWVGTRSGLALLDCTTSRFLPYPLDEEIPAYNITDISPASDGGVWIANLHDGFTHVSPEGTTECFQPQEIPGMPNSFSGILDDGTGKLYIAHRDNGLSLFDTNTRKAMHFPESKQGIPGHIGQMLLDSRRNLWLATDRGLVLHVPGSNRFITFPNPSGTEKGTPDNEVTALHEDPTGRMWVAMRNGSISYFHPSDLTAGAPESLRFTSFKKPTSFDNGQSEGINTIFRDSYGNTWLSELGGGLSFVPSAITVTFPEGEAIRDASIPSNPVWAVASDPVSGNTYLGETGRITVRKHTGSETRFPLPAELSDKRVIAILPDGDRILAGLNSGGMVSICPESGKATQIQIGSPSTGVHAFSKTDKDKYLLATTSGVKEFSHGKVSDLTKVNDILRGRSVTGIVPDKKGNIWISTFGNGINIFTPDFRRYTFLHPDKLGSGSVKALRADSRGWIWAVTKQFAVALTLTGEGTVGIRRFPIEGGAPIEVMRSIAEDHQGHMWLATDTGIYTWNGSGKAFTPAVGEEMQRGLKFNDNASACSNDGTVLFGGHHGLTEARNTTPENPLPVPVAIVDITCKEDGGPCVDFFPGGTSVVPVGVESFRITFSSPDFGMAGNVEYSVKLEGIDKEWSSPQRANYIDMRNLQPGHYIFKVRSRYPGHPWDNDGAASAAITVKPPIWATWWAKVLYALAVCTVLAMIMLAYRQRVRLQSSLELERKRVTDETALNQERLRFYTNITHELRTPLTLILGPLEDLMADPRIPAPLSGKVKMMHASASRLLHLVNELLEFRKTETQNRRLAIAEGDIFATVAETGLRFKELNQNPDVEMAIDVPARREIIPFDREIVVIILNNLLSNAFKYTPGGTITLKAANAERGGRKGVEISVADTGYGIPATDLPHIFERYYQSGSPHQASGTGIGLALVKSLCDLHKAEITLESEEGKGSVFTVFIPAGGEYPDALRTSIPAAQDPSDGEKEEPQEERLPSVLIVEDNRDIREYIASSLSENYRLSEAPDGREGLRMAQESNPDIIISDLMMPVMDGLEMLRKIKEDVRTSHIPVVLLTAKDTLADKETGYEYGADSYLTKPFSATLLRKRIENLLASRRMLATMLTKPETPYVNSPAQPQETPAQEPPRLSRIDREFLQKFTTLVEENISNPELDVSMLTQRLNMSASTLYRKLKGLTGMSGNEFIRKVRLRHAVEMMREGYNVSESAYGSGFNDLGHFRASFKQEYGLSPTAFLKKNEQDRTANQTDSIS